MHKPINKTCMYPRTSLFLILIPCHPQLTTLLRPVPRSQGLIWQTPWFSEKKKVLESPPTIHGNGKITTFPWKSHSNAGCWWMFHCYITLLQLVWYQQGAKIKVFSDSIQYDPIHLMAVKCILYMLHSLVLCKGMLDIEPSMLLRVAKLSGAVIPGSRTYQRDQPWWKWFVGDLFQNPTRKVQETMIPEMDRNGLCEISSVDQSGKNLQPTNQTGQPTN